MARQHPNLYSRLAARLCFYYQAFPSSVVRVGFGVFHELLNGVNYVNSVVTNGSPTHRTDTLALFDLTQPANQQSPTFPNTLNNVAPVPSSNLSLVHPAFQTPYVLAAGLEVQQTLRP